MSFAFHGFQSWHQYYSRRIYDIFKECQHERALPRLKHFQHPYHLVSGLFNYNSNMKSERGCVTHNYACIKYTRHNNISYILQMFVHPWIVHGIDDWWWLPVNSDICPAADFLPSVCIGGYRNSSLFWSGKQLNSEQSLCKISLRYPTY